MGSESIALNQRAVDSEAIRVRGIIVSVKSNHLVKIIETKQPKLLKLDLKPFFWFSKPVFFATSGL